MPLRYKVGDKVLVRSDISAEDIYENCHFVDDMEQYRGQIMTIGRISESKRRYFLVEDEGVWCWVDEFFEDVNQTFFENNVVLLRNGQIRLVHNDALYLPNGKFIEIENYTDRKHNFDENFDIIEVHRKPSSNYLFDLSGELIQEEK